MTLLDEIAVFLVAQGVGVLGSTLFKGLMPDSPHACVAIYEYGGRPAITGFSKPGIQHEYPGLQVVSRGVAFDYAGPRAKIELAYRALSTVQAQTLSGAKYLMLRAQQSPFVLERDGSNRVKFAVNFIAEKELSP